MVRPQMEYVSPIWDLHQKGHISKLEKVQHRGARYVLGKPHNPHSRDSVSDMISGLGWESLETRRKKSSLIFLYKITHSHVSIPKEYHPDPVHKRTRTVNPYPFRTFQPNIDAFKYSFFPRTVNVWNNTPITASSLVSVDAFKHHIQGLPM